MCRAVVLRPVWGMWTSNTTAMLTDQSRRAEPRTFALPVADSRAAARRRRVLGWTGRFSGIAVPNSQPQSQDLAFTLRFAGTAAPKRAGVTGLEGVDLDLAPGDFLLVHGEAGAGKSLLLGLAGLTLRPSAGRVEVLGLNPWRLSAAGRARLRRRMGLVFQDMDLIGDLTVAENAALPMRIAGARPEVYRRDAAELLDWMGLGGRAGAYPQDLDHDEQQRLAVARAVAGRPEIILADEPVGWMGPEAARRVLRLLLQLNRQGATLVMASRNPDLVPAPRRLELVRGRPLPESRGEAGA